MSLSSNINCCVPLCNQRGALDANRKRVRLDPNLRAQCLQKIRRDVGTKFKLTEITKVCSLHFRESEIKKGLGGKKMSVDITQVPSKFAWRTSLFSMNRFSFGKKRHFFPSDCPSHDAVGEFTVSSELEATAELLELVGTINT